MPPFRDSSFTDQKTNSQREIAQPSDPFYILGIIFLVISAITSAAVVGYGFYLENKSQKIKVEIDSVNTSLQDFPLEEMFAFYKMVDSTSNILAKKNYMSSVFFSIEAATDDDVYFKDFNITDTSNSGSYRVTMTGSARSYKAIVRQMDNFKNKQYEKVFKNSSLTSVKDDGGRVEFKVNLDVATNVMRKELNFLNGSGDSAGVTTVPATAPPVLGDFIEEGI